jgi:hypothetical protein
MKFFAITFTAAIALCGAAFAGSADTITAHLSTPVVVGQKTLPAGDITMNVVSGTSDYPILAVRAQNGESVAVVVSRINNTDEQSHASLVLERRGDQLKLERVWLDDGTGFAVIPDGE